MKMNKPPSHLLALFSSTLLLLTDLLMNPPPPPLVQLNKFRASRAPLQPPQPLHRQVTWRRPRRLSLRKRGVERGGGDTEESGRGRGENGRRRFAIPTRRRGFGSAPSTRRRPLPGPTTRPPSASAETEPSSTSPRTSELSLRLNLTPSPPPETLWLRRPPFCRRCSRTSSRRRRFKSPLQTPPSSTITFSTLSCSRAPATSPADIHNSYNYNSRRRAC